MLAAVARRGAPEALEREARRLFARYQLEIVEGLQLCPWAASARESGRVDVRVLPAAEPDAELVLATVDALARDPRVEIGILLFPAVALGFEPFERLVAEVAAEDQRRREIGTVPFALAAFHPDSPLDAATPERLVPFLRRTPDPTVQLVRCEALERVRRGSPEGTSFLDLSELGSLEDLRPGRPLRERVSTANFRTVTALGLGEVEARLHAIRADRDATYARLAEEAPG